MPSSPLHAALFLTLLSGAAAAQCPTTAYLVANDPHALDTFGASLSAYHDTTTTEPRIAIGASDWDAPGALASGRVYVHGKVGNAWGQLSTVQPQTAEANQHFGAAVAAVDPYMIVGSPNAGAADSGSASFYERAGATWSHITTVTPAGTGEPNAHAGSTVALTTNGGIFAAIGAPDHDQLGDTDTGGVYFYKRVNGQWTYSNTIQGNDFGGEPYDAFGYSLALAPDNAWGVAGAPERTVAAPVEHGTVTLFKRNASGQYIYNSLIVPFQATSNMRFGHSVAIRGDVLVVGAPNRAANSHSNAGSAYVYRNAPGTDTWDLEQILTTNPPVTGMLLGTAVAIQGNRIAVNAESTHQTLIFEHADSGWFQAAVLSDPGDPDTSFAYTGVALLDDHVFTAAPYDDQPVVDQGTVHVNTLTSPVSDTPEGATVIQPGTENTNRYGCTTTATPSAFQAASCGNGSTPSPDIWLTWTPACDVNVIFDTYGSAFDTVLSVHSGIPQPSSTYQVACNDDANFASPYNRNSLVTFNATAGQQYYIRISGYNGASGACTLRTVLAYAGSQDTPAQARTVTAGVTDFRTCNATSDGLPVPCNGQAAKDVWFSYVPQTSGATDINTCVSAFDTVMVVYTGTPQTGPQQVVGCNDDGSCGGFPSLNSRLNLNLSQGQGYLIRVGGFDPLDFGEGTLVINPPATCDSIDFNNDSLFPDTQDITDFITVFSGGNCAAPNPPQCNPDIDFNNDDIFPDTADIEALLRVFSGGACQ
ncbi:MAG: FG-GAP repeat protein [Phycisphaerales bacterium]